MRLCKSCFLSWQMFDVHTNKLELSKFYYCWVIFKLEIESFYLISLGVKRFKLHLLTERYDFTKDYLDRLQIDIL